MTKYLLAAAMLFSRSAGCEKSAEEKADESSPAKTSAAS